MTWTWEIRFTTSDPVGISAFGLTSCYIISDEYLNHRRIVRPMERGIHQWGGGSHETDLGTIYVSIRRVLLAISI